MTKSTAPQNPFIVSIPRNHHDEVHMLPAINNDYFLTIMNQYANYLSTRHLEIKFSDQDKTNFINWVRSYRLRSGGFPDCGDFQTVAYWMLDSGYLSNHQSTALAEQVREDLKNDSQ